MHKDDSKTHLNKLSSDGISNLNDGKPKIAIKKFETILLHHPNHPKILNLIGLAYYQLKNLNIALKYIMKAIANDSKERLIILPPIICALFGRVGDCLSEL